MPRLADVISVLEQCYDPRLAEPWDAVGLVCGDPDAEVERVLFAVDPVTAVVEEAVARRADLVVTHHPLLLRPVHGVAATTFKGRAVHQLISSGIGLFTAHTNADAADPGVSDALAAALGLRVLGPLAPRTAGPGDPPRSPGVGIGRICELTHPETLAEFVRRVTGGLPATSAGVRAAGDPDRPIRRVALCGGAGDSLFEDVRAADVDVFLTADLRHHPASEAMEAGGPALVEAAHWATEWPWLAQAETALSAALAAQGTTVDTYVSSLVTDPWTLRDA